MRMSKFGAGLLALLMMACGVETGTSELQEQVASGEKGTLRLPLVSSAPDGNAYKLVGATFNIVGPQAVTVTDTSADTVEATLLAGAYTVELGGSWHLERQGEPGTLLPAQLLSPNPLTFFVTKGGTTQVRFQFKTPGEGSAEVGINVDSGGWFAGTVQFDHVEGGPEPVLDELMGKSVPFLISFPSSTVSRDIGYKELIVEVPPNLVTVQFGGAPSALLERVAASLKGSPLYFQVSAEPYGQLRFGGMVLHGSSNGFSMELPPSPSFPGAVDTEGVPTVGPFAFENVAIIRSNFSPDMASGPVSVNASP